MRLLWREGLIAFILSSAIFAQSPEHPAIADGLRVWLRADRGIELSNTGKVLSWRDQSPNAVVFSQTNGAYCPTWKAQGFTVSPSVAFSGSFLYGTGTDVQAGTSELSIFIVFKPSAVQVERATLLDQTSAPAYGFSIQQREREVNNYALLWNKDPADGWPQGRTGLALARDDVPQMLSFIKKGNVQEAFLNSELRASVNVSGAMPSGNKTLAIGKKVGASSYFAGEIAEILIYNRGLSEWERQQVETTLSAKYALSDADRDGLPDWWEIKMLGTLDLPGSADPGSVGRTLAQSFAEGKSPWPVMAVSSGLRAWFRADVGVQLTPDLRGTRWTDLSGAGAHGFQRVQAARPLWVEQAFGLLPGFEFTGSVYFKTDYIDLLQSQEDFTAYAVVLLAAEQISEATVADFDADLTGSLRLHQKGYLTNQYRMIWRSDPANGWPDGRDQVLIAQPGVPQILQYQKQGTHHRAYLNGVLQAAGTVAQAVPSPTAHLTLGAISTGSRGFKGKIAEFLLYNRSLEAAEQSVVMQYLKNRYSSRAPGDTDGDGLDDDWERRYMGSLLFAGADDPGGVGRRLSESLAQHQSPWPQPPVEGGVRVWYRVGAGCQTRDGGRIEVLPDMSGNAFHLRPEGDTLSPILLQSGVGNLPAMEFLGAELLSSNDKQFSLASNASTVAIVLRPTVSQVTDATLIGQFLAGVGWEVSQVGSTSNMYQARWSDTSGVWHDTRTPVISNTEGHLLVVVKSNATEVIYLDGRPVAYNEVTVERPSFTASLLLGNRPDGAHGFVGLVTETLIYDRAFGPEDIDALSAYVRARYGFMATQRQTGLEAGSDSSAYLSPAGEFYTWGKNDSGQLAAQDRVNRTVPVRAPGLDGSMDVSIGRFHGLAVNEAGAVRAWGDNRNGQLGDGTLQSRASAALVPGLIAVRAVAVGDEHSLALTVDGKVWAWGGNRQRAVCETENIIVEQPMRLEPLSGITALAAGGSFSLALAADGRVWSWGSNEFGERGDQTPFSRGTPMVVSGLDSIVAIAAGRHHAIALKSDGSVWAWGAGYAGQCGSGTRASPGLSEMIPGLTHISSIAAGSLNSAALSSEGVLWIWGSGHSGQLGAGNSTAVTTPLEWPGARFRSISLGGDHVLAVSVDGAVMAWGLNSAGQLGIPGAGSNANAPMLVPMP